MDLDAIDALSFDGLQLRLAHHQLRATSSYPIRHSQELLDASNPRSAGIFE